MPSSVVIVEFVGIPYSKKTSTRVDMQGLLDNNKVRCEVVEEFNGSEFFYRQRKHSPDVNLVRALHSAQNLIQLSTDPRTEVILVDRGIIDARCWLRWFSASAMLPDYYQSTIDCLIKTIEQYCHKYRVVWLDRDPERATYAHGPQGSIVNILNLTQMRQAYEEDLVNFSAPFSMHRVNSNDSTSFELASRLISTLKLI